MRKNGFTIVELVVVIVVIGILVTLAALGINRYIAQGEDEKRDTNVTVIAAALEKYYDKNGEYPSCQEITASADSVSTLLGGVDKSALVTPKAPEGTTNSIVCGSGITPSNDNDVFLYEGDGTAACTGSIACTSYILHYYDGGDDEVVVSEGKRNVSGGGGSAPAPITDLASVSSCVVEASLTWGAVSGASGYTVNRATDSNFTQNLTSATPSSPSHTSTGLTSGTTYFFRVKPEGVGSIGWSNTSSATPASTMTSATPTAARGVNNAVISWEPPANSDCSTNPTLVYTLQRATNLSFSVGVVTVNNIPNSPPNSYNSTGLAAGVTYYYRMTAYINGVDLGWSGYATAAPDSGGGGGGAM